MIIFLPSDITKINKSSINIFIDNISFKHLIKILIKDITFITIKELIFYKPRNQRTIEIGNKYT